MWKRSKRLHTRPQWIIRSEYYPTALRRLRRTLTSMSRGRLQRPPKWGSPEKSRTHRRLRPSGSIAGDFKGCVFPTPTHPLTTGGSFDSVSSRKLSSSSSNKELKTTIESPLPDNQRKRLVFPVTQPHLFPSVTLFLRPVFPSTMPKRTGEGQTISTRIERKWGSPCKRHQSPTRRHRLI